MTHSVLNYRPGGQTGEGAREWMQAFKNRPNTGREHKIPPRVAGGPVSREAPKVSKSGVWNGTSTLFGEDS